MQAVEPGTFKDIATSIRSLSMDAIQKANSGHPGLPLGCAEIGAVLYGHYLRYNPKAPDWMNRDRFVLSAGHGSMFLYSLLHLAGYDLSLDEIRNFRQLHSRTPGHPEVFETPGVEMTTGPLGQGLATAVGMALGAKMLADRFHRDGHTLFDYQVITLAGDGCMMEGVTSEASSFAAHLKLDNLVILYDANDISLDGDLSESCSEDVAARYKAYGFHVCQVDGHDPVAVLQALENTRKTKGKPHLIVCKTVIGKHSPNKQGSCEAHGSPLGEAEIRLTKAAIGLDPDQHFVVLPKALEHFKKHQQSLESEYNSWQTRFANWQKAYPELAQTLQKMQSSDFSSIEAKLPKFQAGTTMAGRKASNIVLNALAKELPQWVGGSADLSCSDNTELDGMGFITAETFAGRNIKYGVREFGMGAIASGLSLTGCFKPFVGTFLCFSDYVRPAIRLAALSGIDVSYQLTHDSVFLGEDGPTHQPVEHAAALRAIPNVLVFRPADGNEVRASWVCGLSHKGPKAYLLSRQALPQLAQTDVPAAEGVGRGAYIVKPESNQRPIDMILFSSGSELGLTLDVAKALEQKGLNTRVVSVPCFELFLQQGQAYRDQVLAKDVARRVAIEAQVSFGWHQFVGLNGLIIAQDRFGLSAPAAALAKEFGFTVEAIMAKIEAYCG